MFDIAFEVIDCGQGQPGGTAVDAALLDLAATGRAVAAVWEAPSPSLLAPRSYRRYERLEQVRADFERHGLPVLLRPSGGGLVPQGPGIVNLSLAFEAAGRSIDSGDSIYASLCELLQDALATFGIRAEIGEVAGSFCDGRFNLAVAGRKIAGTAQYWKHLGPGQRAVLAHALLLVDVDLAVATGWLNEFEGALGSGRTYDPDAVTSLARCLRADQNGRRFAQDLRKQARAALLQALRPEALV